MNEVTQTLSKDEQDLNFEMLDLASAEWEPWFAKPPIPTPGLMLWRSETEPVEIKGHHSEFVGFMKKEYEQEKKKLFESLQEEEVGKTHYVLGWEVRPHMETDFMTNLFTGKANLRIQAVLLPMGQTSRKRDLQIQAMKYKFRIREDQPNGFGLKPFRVEYQSKGRDDWSWSDWTRYVGYRGDEAEFDTLDEAKSFISNEIKLMADAEPKYHYL